MTPSSYGFTNHWGTRAEGVIGAVVDGRVAGPLTGATRTAADKVQQQVKHQQGRKTPSTFLRSVKGENCHRMSSLFPKCRMRSTVFPLQPTFCSWLHLVTQILCTDGADLVSGSATPRSVAVPVNLPPPYCT